VLSPLLEIAPESWSFSSPFIACWQWINTRVPKGILIAATSTRFCTQLI
jgi:hypothetical protein